MRSLLFAAALAVLAAAASPAAPQDARPFPPGESSQTLEGLNVVIVMPQEFDPAKERSLALVLHGAGGSETGMARSLAHLAALDYVVVAPKSKGQVWEAGDIEAVKRIVASLKTKLHVGEKRLHAAGFSNGGWNLAPVAFDEALRFQSAAWVAAGFNGGKPPKHAKKEMGVIAMAGGDDPNRTAAEATVKLLADKVRTVEVRIQPGLDHKWPHDLMPYYTWWLGVQEGRFVPGECAAFAWRASRDAALAESAATAAGPEKQRAGAFVVWFSPADATNEKAKAFQNDVLRDAMVQRFGAQLPCAIVNRDENAEEFAKLGLKTTPAVTVHDASGKVRTALQDKIDAKSLAAALRSVAPDKSVPKD